MKVVSMCLSRQYASTDMQLDMHLTFQGHAIHLSMRLDEAKHDGVKIIALSFQTQK